MVVGAHDVATGALSLGAVAGGTSVLLGTYSINQVLASRPVTGQSWQTRPFLVEGWWLHMSTSPAGAGCLDWVVGRIGPGDLGGRPDVVAGIAEGLREPVSADGPLFLPFVHGGPLGAPAGGSWLGLRSDHTRASMLSAALEGVAFGHRAHVEALATRLPVSGPVRVGGGGTRSSGWTQLLSDVLGTPVEITTTREASAHGAALLAARAVGIEDDLASAAASVRILRRHEPDLATHDLLTTRYHRYRDAVAALGALDWWPRG